MRVVHVITKGDVGGAQTHVVELSAAQVAAGDAVTVLAGSDGTAMERARRRGVDVRIVQSLSEQHNSWWPGPAFREVRSAIAEIGPDIVHGHSSHAGLIARLVARRDHYASVYTAHGWPFQRGAPWLQRTMSFGGEFVGGHLGDGVICLTQAEADRARGARVVAADRLWVVPNGISDVPESLRRNAEPGADEAVGLVMVARFAPPKLQREVVDAMSTLTSLPWTLTFVGDGPELAECRTAGIRALGDRVQFLGHRDDVDDLLAAHDIALLWSAYEGLPISLLEGMRAGLCCVGSDLPGVRALLLDPPAGVVAATPAELAGAIRTLLDDRTKIRVLGGLARARFEQSYSARAMEASTRSVYSTVLERRSVTRAGDPNR